MRQRRVKGIGERLSVYADLILRAETEAGGPEQLPVGRAARWYQRGSSRYILPEGFDRVYAEFGCGRGQFINALAAADPEGLYVGIEGCKTIVIRALAKARAGTLSNVRCIDEFVNNAAEAFGAGGLDGIFLNFSDPWPKDRHADRRLTAPKQVEAYFRALKPGGFAAFKTDGEDFFSYSFKVFAEAGFHMEYAARDLPDGVASHRLDRQTDGNPCLFSTARTKASGNFRQPPTDPGGETPLQSDSIAMVGMVAQTEYEQKFRAFGRPIYYFKAVKFSSQQKK